MAIRTETYTLPEYWAPYLINGDATGYTRSELREMDVWLDQHPGDVCIDGDGNRDEFRHSNDANNIGGATLDFTLIIHED